MRTRVLPAAVAVFLIASGCLTNTTRLVVSPTAADPPASAACFKPCLAAEDPTPACIAGCPDLVTQEGSCTFAEKRDRGCVESSSFRPWAAAVLALAIVGVLFGAVVYGDWGSSTPSHG